MITTRQMIRLAPETRAEIARVQRPGDTTADIARKLFYARAAAAKEEAEKTKEKEPVLAGSCR